jgi:hypothetical protein
VSPEERNISISRSGLPDLNAALAWAVQRYDQEFTEAQMVKLHVEQIYVLDDSPAGGHYRWTAAVTGMTEETA